MAAPITKGSWDPSKRAQHILDNILESSSEESVVEEGLKSSVEVELGKNPIAIHESDRSQSRVLFLTRDSSVLKEGSLQRAHFLNLSEVFNEVHVMVLCESWEAKKGVDRIGKNVWAYTTSVKYWWQQMFAATALAHSQLTFSDGFRPDIVVALDPFESGLAGLWIAERFDRGFQVHITEDFFDPEFKSKSPSNKWRLRIAKHVLKRTQSVRTSTETIKTQIQTKFKHLKDVLVLPRHYDIHSILNLADTKNIKDAFPQYSFVILFVGKLDHESTLFRALDASRSVLTTKSIGLIVVGDGPNRKEFEKRAEILGIKEQVVFQKDDSELVAYLTSADLLLCTDTSERSDEIVIKAAAAGLPILAAITQLRQDLFTDGESAFLCHKEDTVGFSQKIVKFLNTNSLRTQFSNNARDTIKTRLHEDPNAFKIAYRDTIEGIFSIEEESPSDVPEEVPADTMMIDGQEMKLPEEMRGKVA